MGEQATIGLDPKTIEIIKSSVPVLETEGEKITTAFYKRMFSRHPELLNIFNHANQEQGRQQTALANSVYAAAANIDQLENILPVVKQIGHKHRSLGVKPEHYPIVGENLLWAIGEVLGEAATDELLEAWEKAYGVIADAFISVERDMYAAAEGQAGGWKDFRDFVVYKKVKESDVITSFYLKPKDEGDIATFIPGQYISVKVQIDGEQYTHIRQYSLSGKTGEDYYRISVKREDQTDPNGVVSTYLHNNVQEGDVLPISAPAGDFVLNTDSERPLVLISGGVGLTPLVSMLHEAATKQPDRKITFIHAAINGNNHALREEVEAVCEANPNVSFYCCYESPTDEDKQANAFDKEGYIDLEWLQSVNDSKDADFYFCGPVPFMKAINDALTSWGVEEEQINYEFFGPAMQLA